MITKPSITGLFFLLLSAMGSFAQLSAVPGLGERVKRIYTHADTVVVDTLSLVPGSVKITDLAGNPLPLLNNGKPVFTILEASSVIIFEHPASSGLADSLLITYRVFPLLLTRDWSNRSRDVIEKTYGGQYNPFTYPGKEGTGDPFRMEGLQRNGNITRGITFGNNQDAVVSSAFNLQLAGKLNDDVEILAAITDNNIPVQPEGNTQQLQDFDKVFIQLSKNKTKLIAGDFELRRPDSYFMNFFKKGQGGVFTTEYAIDNRKDRVMRTAFSGAVSKGKFARKVFNGEEGNQGPYKLTGADNETFIIVLSGSEKIYVDGKLLTRGENDDYVIDYNTAEVRFTPRQPITKDKRIVAEFQYSDKNYSRTMFFVNQEYEDRRWKIKGNMFSEQDAKNQPLLQDLDNFQKAVLASVGDSLQLAVSPAVDSVAFNPNEVLYEKIDSAGYVFYRYTTDSTKAFFRLGFSLVGKNKGNYEPQIASANGRVYRWIEPLNGIPQGSYEPVTLLISPKKQQLFTFGTDYKNRNGKTFVEGALSRNDINLFSDKDKSDDAGFAVAAGSEQTFALSQDSLSGWKMTADVRFEHTDRHFRPIENYRSVEFSRDWNLTTSANPSDENAISGGLRFFKGGQQAGYRLKSFSGADNYKGYMHLINVQFNGKAYAFNTSASLLNSSSRLRTTSFLRSASELSRKIGSQKIGLRYEQEQNLQHNTGADSLATGSQQFNMAKLFWTSSDTSRIRYRADLSRRYDDAPLVNSMKSSTIADEVSGQLEFNGREGGRLAISSLYRNLTIVDTLLTVQIPEETFLNRMEYSGSLLKGALTLNTFYEAGSGQELKKEYAFLEVSPGNGVYTYAGDYNGNGVKDLDEFEVAAFSDQANYIKIFLPTNEYVRTRNNQFSQSVALNPSAWYAATERKSKFISRLSNQTSYRTENKSLEEDVLRALNPFNHTINDSLLVTTSYALRSTLYYNRSATIFGADITYSDNGGKSILTNGAETRKNNAGTLNFRWNLTKVWGLLATAEKGNKTNHSELLQSRDYKIANWSAEPKITIQTDASFRISIGYRFQDRLNEGGEHSQFNTASAEVRYTPVNKGMFSAKFSLIQIGYNAPGNSPVAYEMLEALQPGKNYTWNIGMQRNISKSLQISLNYDGRKPEGIKTIHTGSMQARAFF